MSIILKGIDMPKNGDCHHITIYDNGNTYITTSNILYETDRKDVEAMQIPTPHWGLIDKSVLFKEYQNLCNELLCRDCPFFKEKRCSIEEWILNQPSILEAEGVRWDYT